MRILPALSAASCLSVGIAAIITAAHPAVVRAAPCRDIPLRVTLFNDTIIDATTGATTPSAIRSDGGEYTTASIMLCSGTNDAVLNLGGTKRTFTFSFPAPIEGSVIEGVPAWVPGTYAGTGWINIRNITFSKQPFATMAGSTFTLSADRATYRLGFKGLSADLPNAPNIHGDPDLIAADNVPFPSSPVVVYPSYPPVCGAGSMPNWLVRATSPNNPDSKMSVGSLHQKPSKPTGTEVHQGQYSMPFEMRIEALKCFTY